MARQLQLRKGNTSQHNSFTGAIGEVTVDTDKKTIVVHDGVTQGGSPLATELSLTNLANATYTSVEVDDLLDDKVNTSTITSVNLLRPDKYLASQTIVNLIRNAQGKLEKVRYNADTDTDYEVLSYTNGKLTNVAHYIGGVLKGNTSLNYVDGLLVSTPFTAV